MDTHTLTHAHRHTLTDANQLYNMSYAIYYSYGTDNTNTILQMAPSDLNDVLHSCLYSTTTITAAKMDVQSNFVGLETVKLAIGIRISITATCSYQKVVFQT